VQGHQASQSQPVPLTAIKLVHTLAWAAFASCIIALPVASWRGAHGIAALLFGIVAVEVVVLAFNAWTCPLTSVAARYTSDRKANFDIYLPLWLARYNKQVFGSLYVGGSLFALANWLRS
jgi:hypothetical protein